MSRKHIHLYRIIALLIVGAFIYVQAMALTCGAGHLFAAHHHAASAQHEHQKENKGCCTDFTQAFLSAFAKSQTINPEFSCKQPVMTFVLNAEPLTRNNSFYRESVFIDDSPHPPPKIPDIRIFIRSFQV
jgi:hypothetical protein